LDGFILLRKIGIYYIATAIFPSFIVSVMVLLGVLYSNETLIDAFFFQASFPYSGPAFYLLQAIIAIFVGTSLLSKKWKLSKKRLFITAFFSGGLVLYELPDVVNNLAPVLINALDSRSIVENIFGSISFNLITSSLHIVLFICLMVAMRKMTLCKSGDSSPDTTQVVG